MSNVQKEQAKLDQLARLQQMRLNTRLTSLETAKMIMSLPGFANSLGAGHEPGKANCIDHLTLIAMATDIEKYILGEIEAETQKAMNDMQQALTKPQIVRP